MRKLLTIICCCLTLVGCETMQQQPQKSQAQMENERIAAKIRNGNVNSQVCQDDAKKSELYKRVYEEIFFEDDKSANKFAMLANKNKPSNEQIELLKDAMPILTKCRTAILDGYANTPFLTLALKYFNAIDAMYIKLVRGEMTIGDANEERVKAFGQRNIDWSTTVSEVDARFRSMHESEMQGRRQAAAAMLPYLMQQQQNQQLQQQMLYQQQMQSIVNNRPVLTSPTTTNCTTYGNQTNCISR